MKKLKNLFLFQILSLIHFNAVFAQISKSLGSGSQSLALGNQLYADSTNTLLNPELNTQIPASITEFDKPALAVSFTKIKSSFSKMTQVIVNNKLTGAQTEESADFNPQIDSLILQGHFIFPFTNQFVSALSVEVPTSKVMGYQSEGLFQPAYIYHQNQYERFNFFMNFAYQLSKEHHFSIGVSTNYHVAGKTVAVTNLSGSSQPSLVDIDLSVKPDYSLLLSYQFIKHSSFQFYSNIWQKVESKVNNETYGVAPLGGNTSVDYQFNVKGTIAYQPTIVQIGFNLLRPTSTYLIKLDYQKWSDFQGNQLTIENAKGVVANGQKLEIIKYKNIWVPHLGYEKRLNSNYKLQLGYYFRPSIIEKDFSSAGNSLDAATHALSVGGAYNFYTFNKNFEISCSIQYQQLKKDHIKKDLKLENGESGKMIGYPGYDLGGSILISSFGFNYHF